MSNDSISFKTPLGILPLSVVGSFLFILKIKDLNLIQKTNKIYGLSLVSLFSFILINSLFRGNSILGNLIRSFLCIFLAYSLPYIKIDIDTWANSLRKIIFIHSSILFFDFFFETPWGWAKGLFYIGFKNADLWRASGLYAEPSYYCLAINSLLMMLVLLRKSRNIDILFVLISTILSTSITGVLCTFSIVLFRYKDNFFNTIKNLIYYLKIESRKMKIIILTLSIIATPLIFIANHEFTKRITQTLKALLSGDFYSGDPTAPLLLDTSFAARTFGLFPYIKYILSNAPINGVGLGTETVAEVEKIIGETTRLDFFNVTTTLANSIVYVFFFGGFTALILFSIYVFSGIGFNMILIPYLVLLSSSGKVFFVLPFLIPAIGKYMKENYSLKSI